MKVSELIQELQKMPQDLEIKIDRFMDDGGPEIFENINQVVEYHDRYYTCQKGRLCIIKIRLNYALLEDKN